MSRICEEGFSPRSAISALACGYSRDVRKRKTLMMLTVFVDDSTSDDADKLLVLAGYVHNADAWESFSDDWQNALDADPRIEYFKMREAESLRGQFLGWDPIAKNAKVHALADVIVKHKPWSIESYISKAQYERTVGLVVPWDIRHPYLDLFYALVIKVAQWHHSMGLRVPVDFVFDEQGQMGTDTAMWYQQIRSQQPPEIQELLASTPVFRDDKKVLPLQASDLLAWHLRRGKEDRNKSEFRPVAEKLFPLMHATVELGDDYLRNVAGQMAEVMKEMSEVAPHLGTLNKKSDSIMPVLRYLAELQRKKDETK